jgi:flagellar biosynthesis/type III secretory pathway protein FliH
MSFVTISRNKTFVQSVLSQDVAAIAAQEAEMARRVRQEVAKLRDAAEAEGRAAGEAAIHAIMAPRAAALETALAALQEAALQLAAPLAQKERDLAALSVELAYLLARHISQGADANLQGLVTKLLDEAAAERGARQTLRLRLNPADHIQLDGRLPAESAELVADEKITPGGAVVEIITPDGDPVDKIEWDATLEGRWETIRAALGLPGEAA